ncbi:MAG: ferredoxin--NADP reductase [Bdellovibrionia bacterium]
MSSARKIHSMKVQKIIDHTAIVRELVLSLEDEGEFKFKAGQFAMLHVPQEGKPALRAYSIASADSETKGFRLLFKYVDNGLASQFVWSLKGGEVLQFTGPFGKVLFQEPPTEQIVFLNTGTGYAQHISYLLSFKDKYPTLKYKLLFGVRTEQDIYLQSELEQLKAQLPNFEYDFVLSRPSDSWAGKKGYVQNFLKDFDYKNVPTTFYLCGNGAMIKDVKHQLLEVDGLDKSLVWAEAFD